MSATLQTVLHRNGQSSAFSEAVLLERIQTLCAIAPPLTAVEPSDVYQQLQQYLCDQISTTDITNQLVKTCSLKSVEHYDYLLLASRALVFDHHHHYWQSFSQTVRRLADADIRFHPTFLQFVETHAEALDAAVQSAQSEDYRLDVFGFQTLKDSYFLRTPDKTFFESAQHMYMRIAIQVMGMNERATLAETLHYFSLLSTHKLTHATPTCYNSGMIRPQLASCYLLVMEDSLDSIYGQLMKAAIISKYGGGIGLSIDFIRSIKSRIVGTNGESNGLMPMMRVYNATAKYVDQGGGKRKGAIAMYLTPWHPEIKMFSLMRKGEGEKCHSLNHGVMMPDFFLKRMRAVLVEKRTDVQWTLFDPSKVQDLKDLTGQALEDRYVAYEQDPSIPKQVLDATAFVEEVIAPILTTWAEMGQPYIQFSDSINALSNQRHLGVIRNPNLCTEVVQYATPNETAMCNLASIGLPQFVRERDWSATATPSEEELFSKVDWAKLYDTVWWMTRALNNVIDLTYYVENKDSVSEPFVGRENNLKHRPMGIGVQGLADVFFKLRIPFTSLPAQLLNRRLFEWIYLAALESSVALAATEGPHPSFAGSPLSEGKFQFDLARERDGRETPLFWPDRWRSLREQVMRVGTRNALFIAPMPTASTSQIMGNVECFEPATAMVYVRNTKVGQFVVLNKYMMRWLEKLLPAEKMGAFVSSIQVNGGSLLREIEELRKLMRKVGASKEQWQWLERYGVCETFCDMPSMMPLINMANARGKFIDQSQSFNVRVNQNREPKQMLEMLAKMILYHWEQGGKGFYYCHKPNDTQSTKSIVCGVSNHVSSSSNHGSGKRKREEDEVKKTVVKCDEEVCVTCSA